MSTYTAANSILMANTSSATHTTTATAVTQVGLLRTLFTTFAPSCEGGFTEDGEGKVLALTDILKRKQTFRDVTHECFPSYLRSRGRASQLDVFEFAHADQKN